MPIMPLKHQFFCYVHLQCLSMSVILLKYTALKIRNSVRVLTVKWNLSIGSIWLKRCPKSLTVAGDPTKIVNCRETFIRPTFKRENSNFEFECTSNTN